ncbi:AIR synthase family protein [Anaerosporobacter faecicola]|uniref:AIR synthase family protein n=1 Tax=Anaerosporobacter faecicola TaxID=2718714 RepID=UPI00143B89C7|nr:AIR synthase family protein [Anaerosporobacter faecicola]
MKVGKVPEMVLKRSVFKQIRHRRNEVLVGPGVGLDCSVFEVGPDEAVVLSTDPITSTADHIGDLAIHITANDIAASGAEMIGVMLTIIMPERGKESELRQMMQRIEACCASLNIEVMGGHSEVSRAVNQTIVTVTGVGKITKTKLSNPKQMKEGQEIVLTKWAGLEGTAILANEKKEELCTRYTTNFIEEACTFLDYISIVKEATIARKHNAVMMHDVTEGGIFGALWEVGAAGNVGIEVDLNKIPMKQETVEICEYYDLNPYMLISSGSLLIVTDRANELVEHLEKEKIKATVIGRVTSGTDRIAWNDYEKRYLEPPKVDELYKVLR